MNEKKTESDDPKVSVIIPCYNHGRFLDEAVESVLNQTFRDFEIIIVNDGSTDEYTNELLREYHRSRTTVYTIENSGLSSARNYGIEKSNGEYILPLDADDKIAPRFLEKCLSLIEGNPDLGFVYSYVRFFGYENGVWHLEPFDEQKLLLRNILCVTTLFRRKAFDDVGGFCSEMKLGFEDWDFWIGMVEKGWNGYQIPEYLFYYRKRPGTMGMRSDLPHNRVKLLRQIVKNHHGIFAENLPYILSEKEKTILMQEAYIQHLNKEYAELLGTSLFRIYLTVVRSVLRILRPLLNLINRVESFL